MLDSVQEGCNTNVAISSKVVKAVWEDKVSLTRNYSVYNMFVFFSVYWENIQLMALAGLQLEH